MKKVYLALAAIGLLVGSIGATSIAGEVLDRLVNNMVLDSASGLGMVDWKKFKTITAETPLGQTFTTGPKVVEISRIAVALCSWHESWTPDKSVVLTLWDSPAKSNRIASAEMPYKWREWEGTVVMYRLNAKVQPETKYYFELTCRGGDGKIAGVYTGGKYSGGEAYEAGKPAEGNLWFQIHARRAFDRDAAYADRFSEWNLDWPGLEKVKAAVASKDWDKAVDELIAFYQSRPDLISPTRPKPQAKPGFDRSYEDLVTEQKIKDEDGAVVDLGPNWNYYHTWAKMGGVGLTRTGLMGYLRRGYMNTADEKFAKAFDEMMTNVLSDEPSPLRAGQLKPDQTKLNPAPEAGIAGGSMWAGLSTAARMNQMWFYYEGFVDSPNFSRDIRAAMIFNMVDMATVLSMQKGGGNWEAQMSSALFDLADRHPELARAKEWFAQGLGTLLDNLWTTCRPDGPIGEPTFNYNCLVVNRFTRTLTRCRQLGIPVEQRYTQRVEKALEYIMYSTKPDWDLPSTGDTPYPFGGLYLLQREAPTYGRDDFLWVGTEGKQGKPPTATSCQFPITGWYVMRSDWTPDALYLDLHNGINTAHGHDDELQIVLSAYGSNLIVDPGQYIYGTPEAWDLGTTHRHATITVDGRDTKTEKGRSLWASTALIDFYDGTNAGYGRLPGISHTRKIAFLKPDYWMLSDTVTGEGEHEVVSRFPFAPGEVWLDAATGAFHTENAGGNLLILPVPGSGFVGAQYETYVANKLTKSPAVSYTKKAALPFGYTALLLPYKGRAVPKASVRSLGAGAYRVESARGTDYICFGGLSSDDIGFHGAGLVVRTRNGRVRSATWVNGDSATLAGKLLASSDKPIENLELVRDGDALTVTSSSEEPSLKVAALGAKHYRVNNGPLRDVAGATLKVFGR